MSKRIGTNTNSNTETTITTHSVGSGARVDIVPALADGDPPHITISVANKGNRVLWVGKIAAAGSDLVSVPISPGESKVIVSNSDIYRGAISAIFESGGTRDVVTEVM